MNMRIIKELILSCSVIALISLMPLAFAKPLVATFAGGCFWCVEADFDKVKGVLTTVSGYTGGNVTNPSYEQVSAGGTGHYEAVQVYYDPNQVSYETLVDYFWRHIDPTDASGQFCDKGDQYRTAIFYSNGTQRKIAETSKAALLTSGQFEAVVTAILPAKTFYPAEEYHQEFYLKNPVRYRYYRFTCGRDQRIKKLWEGP